MKTTDSLMLIKTCETYAAQIAGYRAAFLTSGDSLDGTGPLRRYEDPIAYIRMCESLDDPTSVIDDNWVHATQYLCIRQSDHRLVGMIQLRWELNDYLRDYAGHIGYSVRPDERRKGYAEWMLHEVLSICAERNIRPVLVSCLTNNEASRRTILANGGQYLNTVTVPDSPKQLERYAIDPTMS